MELNEWFTIINTIVGLVGIIVGIIGWRSLSAATDIRNNVKGVHDSTVQQAQIINNGLDDYAVIRLSKETTEKELEEIIKKIGENETRLRSAENELENMPKIAIGKEGDPVPQLKNGDIYLVYED